MKAKHITRIAVAALALLTVTSCNFYKKFDLPADNALQKDYAEAVKAEIDSTAFGNLAWQEVFTDPVLAGYIQKALDNNIDLANAKLNVDIAHANLNGARMAYAPSLALSAQGGASSVGNASLSNWTYTIPLTASWELDVFGKLLNNKRGAQASYRRMQDYEQAVRSQIIGAVANCYYSIAALNERLAISEATAKIWGENVEIMRNYKLAGRTNEAAVVQSQANYLSICASIRDLKTAIVSANNTLSLLLGETPQIWPVADRSVLDVPAIVREEIPMRELAARPDVKAAEESLAAAYYTTNTARAAFYPGITITANYGFTNSFGSFIKNPGDWIASLTGQLVAPLFARGQNIARLKAAKAQQEQAVNNFTYKLLSASAEVSNAMTSYENYTEKAAFVARQVEQLEKSVYYTKELFASGGSTYLEVLTSQSSLLQAQLAQVETNLGRAQALINLYQSLGGGR